MPKEAARTVGCSVGNLRRARRKIVVGCVLGYVVGRDKWRQLRVEFGAVSRSRAGGILRRRYPFLNAVVGEHGEVQGRVGRVETSHFRGWVQVSVFR